MAEYVIEIVKGDDHLYICRGAVVPPPEGAVFPETLKTKVKIALDPRSRNAVRIEGYREVRKFVECMMALTPKGFRKMVQVPDDWDRPIYVNIHRDSPERGVVDTPSQQRMYQFKEAV